MSDLPPSNQPNPFSSPSVQSPPSQAPSGGAGDATGGVIPYKNAPALISYYLGILSLLPCIGLLFGVPAFVLGIMGLKKRKKNPEVKGSVHAWIGIVLGGICSLIWGASIVMMIIAAANAPR